MSILRKPRHEWPRNAARTETVVDVIDGQRNPELLLPTELFEWTINGGLIDGWTDYADRARSAGLPSDF